MLDHVPSWAWGVWVVLSLGTFVALETFALRSKSEGDTLSENIRRWLGVEPAQPWKRYTSLAFCLIMTGFTIWFIPHILWAVW